MAHCLRVLTGLPQDPSSVLRTHIGQFTTGCNSSSIELPSSDTSAHVHILLPIIKNNTNKHGSIPVTFWIVSIVLS